jgi:serine/threonine-protein kinase RsbW
MAFRKELILKSAYEEVEKVENLLLALQTALGFDDDFYARLMLAVSEAATNAIVHGNKLDTSKKAVIVAESDGKQLTFTTTDEGEGFVPEEVADPLAPENLLKPSGRGVFLMKEFADDVAYLNDGRTLVLKFNLSN